MPDTGNGRAGRADVLIVGGGSAGAVLAARLSEDPTRSVLLLEAGRAYGVDGYPDDLLDAARVPANPEHEWGFKARGSATSPEIDAARAKVLGGCSAHNATVAMRARPSDIRDWQQHGLPEWTVADVEATFVDMENSPDGEDAYHGRTGPFPIRQLRYDDVSTSLRGFIDATAAEGFRLSDDSPSRPAPTGSTSSPSAGPSQRRATASAPPRPGRARNSQGPSRAVGGTLGSRAHVGFLSGRSAILRCMGRPRQFDPEEVLERSMREFWERGYHETSVDDLVAVTGVRPGSLYNAFPGGKRGLFLDALDRYSKLVVPEKMGDLERAGAGLVELRAYFDGLIEDLTTREGQMGCLMVNSAMELAAVDSEVGALVRGHMERLERNAERALRNAKRRGEVRKDVDPRAKAAQLMATGMGLMVVGKTGPERKILTTIVDAAFADLSVAP